jgi:hypothetical protein
LLVALAVSAANQHALLTPTRFAYDALFLDAGNSGDGIIKALSSNGLLVIKHIPEFKESKLRLMSSLHSCMMDIGESSTITQHFDDGTTRRSFAAVTLPVGGAQPLKSLEHLDDETASKSESCASVKKELASFRSAVDTTTKLFAHKLSSTLGAYLEHPLMTSNVEGVVYDTIDQVVSSGEHLEHFHSYQKDDSSVVNDEISSTIGLHTDQGFFIAFTPGLITSLHDPTKKQKLSDGFYVEDSMSGEISEVKFNEDDDLVFMVGDGANQYINNRLVDLKETFDMRLRATPHSLSFKNNDPSVVRVWYGRMILPPSNALLYNKEMTYGEVRKSLIDAGATEERVALGCSSQDMQAVVDTSRHLSGPSIILNCTADELFCWYRCQPIFDDLKTCAERNTTLECVDPQGQISDPAQHNGAIPACYNSSNSVVPDVNWQGDDHHNDHDGHSHGDDVEHSHGDDGHHDDMMNTQSTGCSGSLVSVFTLFVAAAFSISALLYN